MLKGNEDEWGDTVGVICDTRQQGERITVVVRVKLIHTSSQIQYLTPSRTQHAKHMHTTRVSRWHRLKLYASILDGDNKSWKSKKKLFIWKFYRNNIELKLIIVFLAEKIIIINKIIILTRTRYINCICRVFYYLISITCR